MLKVRMLSTMLMMTGAEMMGSMKTLGFQSPDGGTSLEYMTGVQNGSEE